MAGDGGGPVSSRRRSREYWQAQVEACRRSGLSQVAFCRRRGLRTGKRPVNPPPDMEVVGVVRLETRGEGLAG
jgi:hypothetical protein